MIVSTDNQDNKKVCTKCRNEKSCELFYRDKKTKDGFTLWCKECQKKPHQEWYLKNKERISKRIKYWRAENPDKVRRYERTYCEKHPDRIAQKLLAYAPIRREVNRRWMKNHPDKVREYVRRWSAKNPEKVKAKQKIWILNNPERIKVHNKQHHKKRYGTIRGRLNASMAVSIRRSLNGNKNGRKWELLAGFTVEQLKGHLEKHFLPGMSWDNRNEWHIDHKIPKSVFNYERPEDIDFKKCWSLKNLQPMWSKDNIYKGDKLNQSFQPSLQISCGAR